MKRPFRAEASAAGSGWAVVLFAVTSLIALCPASSRGQSTGSGPVIEQGRFRLFWVQRSAGVETYVIRERDGLLRMESDFRFSNRDVQVPLKTTLLMRSDYRPVDFSIRGKMGREQNVATEVRINGQFAEIDTREGETARFVNGPFFTIAGYAPASVQMLMLRYWDASGRPPSIQALPEGRIAIELRGRDTVAYAGTRIVLDRYGVEGVVWGSETLWTDARGKLIAALTIDGEGEPFQIVRDGFEDLLPFFVARGVEDGVDRLTAMGRRRVSGARTAFALVGGRVIDGTGRPPISDGVIVIRGDSIEAVGPRGAVEIPSDVRSIDVTGKTLIPGLWDMHAHFQQVEWGPAYLATGVTSVRDCGNSFDFVTSVRDALERDGAVGPRMMLAGMIFGTEIRTQSEGIAAVRRYKNAGFDQIKVYSFVRPELVPVITEEAHKLGMTVTGHVPNGMDVIDAVDAGIDQISHIGYVLDAQSPAEYRSLPPDERPPVRFDSQQARYVIRYLANEGIVVDPTLALYEFRARSTGSPIEHFEPGFRTLPRLLQQRLESGGVSPFVARRREARLLESMDLVNRLFQAGVPIVVGSDMLVPGHSVHREMELLVRSGLTPMQAIRAATAVPAEVMEVDDLGTLEVGNMADIVILNASPLEDIRNIRRIDRVVARGRFYRPDDLWSTVGFRSPRLGGR